MTVAIKAKAKEYLSFLNHLDLGEQFEEIISINKHDFFPLQGWQGIICLIVKDQKQAVYNIDIRYAWDEIIWQQNLIDFTWQTESLHGKENQVNKIIVYLCEQATKLEKEKKFEFLNQHYFAEKYYQSIIHAYIKLPLKHPFILPPISPVVKSQLKLEESESSASATAKQQGGLRVQSLKKIRDENKPLVSIITVVFNGGKYLEQTIQSVINQAYKNWEFIIIDGNSQDNTLEIIKKYEKYIDYWLSEPDRGIYNAMNKGWNLSTGDYILYLGSDDILLNLPTQALNQAWQTHQDIVYGNVLMANGRIFNSIYSATLMFRCTVHHQGLFVRRNLFAHSPFDEQYKHYADFDLNQKMYKQKCTAVKADKDIIVSIFRIEGASSRGKDRQKKKILRKELIAVIKNNFGWLAVIICLVYGKFFGIYYKLSQIIKQKL